ncbi:MAG: AprI/Inh family metalloprotease inhibitor [Variibacter sp.]
MGFRVALLALSTMTLLPALAGNALAQSAMPDEGAKAVLGAWEMSNAERDRSCTVTLKSDASGTGRALQWDEKCAQMFPFTKGVTAWDVGDKDVLRLFDGQGKTVIELSEVEGGLYEGERPGEGLVFLQSTAAEAADSGKTADQVAGEWSFARANGKPICAISLIGGKADALALKLKPGCDAAITDFAPTTWQMDRGQLVLSSKAGDTWRFEEDDSGAWQRIPRASDPLQLMRK